MTKSVWMFPGPSSHVAGALGQLTECGATRTAILDAVDTVAAEYGWEPVSPLLLRSADEASPQHMGHLWLGFFVTSLVLAEVLTDAGVPGDTLVGHSGGEVTAMVVAGCMTVEDAARVLCERTRAVDESGLPPSAMVALNAPAFRVSLLCEAVADGTLAVSVDNGPDQVVVSGLIPALEKLEALASALGIRTHRLKIPSAYHNLMLGAAARHFTDRIRHIPVRAPRRPVYSPQLQRMMAGPDDVRKLLAGTLVLPVRYREALHALYDDGARLFVECGARQVLTDLVPQCLPRAAEAVPLLTGRAQAQLVAQLARTLAAEHGTGWEMGSLLDPGTSRGTPAGSTPVPDADQTAGQTGSLREPLSATRARTPGPGRPAVLTPPVGAAVSPPVTAEARSDDLPAEAELRDRVRAAYAQALRFPTDMVEDDTELEGELGISSLQRTSVFVTLLNSFELPSPEENVQIFKYRTVAEMAGLLRKLAAAR
ncbi:acyltransferase domain-containing protein [Streptomyces sp. SID8352]|uniref:acyltransferase domain-containing protein n=1 Tax=Streptomyces sp. SID8352 TaxID=2690338 RepID=UPI00136881F8|nr:acyltransferase domain-containing protein [Streptomyces sp. SID8352]MYU21131.1 acyltransferase domain-containing protein [Streptomyces sp. SID8352]